jgi:hypothetical protein
VIPPEIEAEMIAEDREFESGSTDTTNPAEIETLFLIDGQVTLRPGQSFENALSIFADFCAINGWTFDGSYDSEIVEWYDPTLEPTPWRWHGMRVIDIATYFFIGVILSVIVALAHGR